MVPDDEAEIVAAVNALRARYTYVFTTGGIGPTHDDITADAIARAFGVGIDYHPEALAKLGRPLQARRIQRDAQAHGPGARRRQPDPEQRVGGAGLPDRQCVRHGRRARDHARDAGGRGPPACPRGGGELSATVSADACRRAASRRRSSRIQEQHKSVAIGSYPYYGEDGFGVQLVVRGRDRDAVEAAAPAIEAAVRALGAQPHAASALMRLRH